MAKRVGYKVEISKHGNPGNVPYYVVSWYSPIRAMTVAWVAPVFLNYADCRKHNSRGKQMAKDVARSLRLANVTPA